MKWVFPEELAWGSYFMWNICSGEATFWKKLTSENFSNLFQNWCCEPLVKPIPLFFSLLFQDSRNCPLILPEKYLTTQLRWIITSLPLPEYFDGFLALTMIIQKRVLRVENELKPWLFLETLKVKMPFKVWRPILQLIRFSIGRRFWWVFGVYHNTIQFRSSPRKWVQFLLTETIQFSVPMK